MEIRKINRAPLGNPDRRYRQDRLMISTFRAKTKDTVKGLTLCKELGFDMVEFGWVSPKDSYECITACEEVGIDGIIQNWDLFGGFQSAEGEKKVDRQTLEKYVEFTKKYRHVAGYYIWDEPFEDDTIQAAAKQVQMMEELDPERIPFTVAIPSYNTKWTWENGLFEGYLRKYAKEINPPLLSLDYYPFAYGHDIRPHQLDDSEIFLDLALMREICLEKKMPLWFYFQTQDSVMDYGYTGFSPEKINAQVYLALLYGAVGLQNYNVYNGAITEEAQAGPLYFHTKELNHRCHQLGRTLMALTSVGAYHSPEVLEGRKEFEPYRKALSESAVLGDKKLPFRISAGEFLDSEGNVYLLVQNRDYANSAEVRLKLKKKFRIYEVSQEDGHQKVISKGSQSLSLKLPAGEGVLLRFQDAQEKPYLVEYVLSK